MSSRRELPVDLIPEIMLRVEAKHVLRCKLISRAIYDLIRSSSFVYEHLHHSQTSKSNRGKNIVYAVEKVGQDRSNMEVHSLSPESKVHLPTLARSEKYWLMLCNPTTGEYRELPVPSSSVKSAFDFKDAFGLGYDAISGDYKVVRITYSSRKKPFVVEVWTHSTNKWRETDFVLPNLSSDQGYKITDSSAGLLVNGNLYWTARPSNHRVPDGEILFSISLADDTFRQITISDVTKQYDDPMKYLMDFRGSPAMVVYEFSSLDETEYDIWVVEDTEGHMTLAKRLSIGPFPGSVAPTRLCFNGNFVMRDSRKESTDRFFLYDSRTQEETQLPQESSPKSYSIMLWNVDESIVSVY